MWYADLLGQWPDTEACFRVSMIEISPLDELIDLVGEDVLTSSLSDVVVTRDKEGCWINRAVLASVYLFHTKS